MKTKNNNNNDNINDENKDNNVFFFLWGGREISGQSPRAIIVNIDDCLSIISDIY